MTEIGKHKHRKRLPRGAASPTSRRRLAARQKQLRALELRIGGASWEQIGEALGFANRSGPFRAVDKLLKQLPVEKIDQLRNMQRERLNRLWLGSWPAAAKGDPQAVANCMRILKRAAELDGLDAPKKLDHTTGGQPFYKAYLFDPNIPPNAETGQPA
jgi:hypothetical protein